MSTAPPPLEPTSIPLEGRLGDPSTLPRLYSWLSRGEWSGMLLVRSGDIERRVYFVEGRVSTGGSTDPAESLSACLIREGLLTEEDRSRAAGQLRTPDRGWAFGRQLVRAGLLQDKDVTRVERRRVVQLAESVLALRTGTYSCEPGQLAGDAQPQQGLDVPRLVAEGVLTHWDANSALEALGGYDALLELLPERLADYEATGAEEAYDYTLLRCNGRRTVREILDTGTLPEAASLRFLAALRLLDIVVTRPGLTRAPAPPPEPEPEPPPSEPPAQAAVPVTPAEIPAALRPATAEPPAVTTGGVAASGGAGGVSESRAAAVGSAASARSKPARPERPRPSTAPTAGGAVSGGSRGTRVAWVLFIVIVLVVALVFFLTIGWREMTRAPEGAAPADVAPAGSQLMPTAPVAAPADAAPGGSEGDGAEAAGGAPAELTASEAPASVGPNATPEAGAIALPGAPSGAATLPAQGVPAGPTAPAGAQP